MKRHVRALTLLAPLLMAAVAAAQDPVPIPGGPASVRRLFHLDPDRPKESFFLELNEFLLSAGGEKASWSDVPYRRQLVDYTEDLAEWKQRFGNPAAFSLASADQWKRTERGLEWLGFRVRGDARTFKTERRTDTESARRQGFLDAVGTPLAAFLEGLRAGKTVTVTCQDDTAPLPFGLAAWRETLDEPSLSSAGAFLFFVKNVRASRMMVALHGLDPETRDGLKSLIRDEKGRMVAWRILYEDELDRFALYPEALMLRDGQFVLPGGKNADPIWTDIFGVAPSDRVRFLKALYDTDSGKGAYVVDTFQHLPDRTVQELLFGKTGGGEKSVRRFHRLYKSIDRGADNYELTKRDPYDFAHLAPSLHLSDEGGLILPAAGVDGSDFPRNDGQLAEEVARLNGRTQTPEETLRWLFRRGALGDSGSFPAQRRFLFVSSLLEQRPALSDPGLVILLNRGLDRFLPAYAALEDLPLDHPELARRYLYTLDRLDRRSDSREGEVIAGLFQGDVEILALVSRAGALDPAEMRSLFASLLDLPIFSRDDTTLAQGEPALLAWFSDRLLAALRTSEHRVIEDEKQEEEKREKDYRGALAARDERILARRAEERAGQEKRRAAAEELLRSMLGPVCPVDDTVIGPPLPVFLEEERGMAESSEGAETARLWMEEALEIEAERARPLRAAAAPVGRSGALPGTSGIVDRGEPFPTFDRIEIAQESADGDELLSRAMAGSTLASPVGWRGGRYHFDPGVDEANRRRAFREKQRLTWAKDLEAIHRSRDAALAAARKGDLAGTKKATAELQAALRIAPSKGGSPATEDERLLKEQERARDAAADIAEISKDGKLAKVTDWFGPLDAMIAERQLETVLGHVYAANASDPNDLYYQDPDFVRRHSFRTVEKAGRTIQSAFSKTALVTREGGKGSQVTGSLFGLSDVLSLLHADQLEYRPGAGVANEDIRSGVVAPVWRVSSARLADDALRFVAASCRATEELAAAIEGRDSRERFRVWNALARDLVTRTRLGLLAASGGSGKSLFEYLSPTDAYRIGRRLATQDLPDFIPRVPAAAQAREALARLQKRYGESGARDRLAEFGPRAVSYAGRFRLTDMDMPAYERLAAYRMPQILSDRLYDLKIAVACRVDDLHLPAAVLPIVLPAALDATLANLRMAYPYDWPAIVRAAEGFSPEDVDRVLDAALQAGRMTRDESGEAGGEGQ